MKVRKKPVVVDAYQVVNNSFLLDAPDWVHAAVNTDGIFIYGYDWGKGVRVNTLEGEMFVPYGSYLIRGVEGEIYGCDSGIFAKTYDILEEETE